MDRQRYQPPLILGIETSCDDTACAVVDGAGRVLASAVSSQLAAHRPYGGVVPEIASREHLGNWPAVRTAALAQAGVGLADLDAVAATRGPGLVGSLLVGLSLAKGLAYGLEKPFFGVHHLEGHLYSPFLAPPSEGEAAAEPAPERFVGLVVSGGHTSLFAVDGGALTTLAETRDDAIGEVFDKVGKRLGLPYPQGPTVDLLAERGEPSADELPIPKMSDGSLSFSFSGLKSETLRRIEALERAGVATDLSGLGANGGASTEDSKSVAVPQEVLDLLAGFRTAAVGQLLRRLDQLRRRGGLGTEEAPKLLAVSGGAAANRDLRRRLVPWAAAAGVDLRLVPLAYSGDNAAMIAYAAALRQRRGDRGDPLTLSAESRIAL
jgi:N6-L-threonylcarbamoyladenine synthase